MVKITLKIDGMMCGMCEAHVNDAVRSAFPVRKVTSSPKNGKTVILCEQNLTESALRETIEKTGYRVLSFHSEPYRKKSSGEKESADLSALEIALIGRFFKASQLACANYIGGVYERCHCRWK